jgi:hypothetical protein
MNQNQREQIHLKGKRNFSKLVYKFESLSIKPVQGNGVMYLTMLVPFIMYMMYSSHVKYLTFMPCLFPSPLGLKAPSSFRPP